MVRPLDPRRVKDRRSHFARPNAVVEFRVVNGLAIAMGDIVVGVVPADFPGDTGFYELQRPQLWRSNEIPYLIEKDLPQESVVREALRYFAENTVIRFIPYEGQADAVVFARGEKHCLSQLGRVGGLQAILLAPDCGRTEILHEIMHALGFVHEQSLPQRDRYIEIMWDNIDETAWSQFAVLDDDSVEGLLYSRFSFDYQSIMLYPPSIFARDLQLGSMRTRTDTPLRPRREALSPTDIERLDDVY
jgi:hypothetical protein